MQHIHAEFGFFEIWFVLSWNSSMTLPYTRNKGALPWQPIFVLKLLLMHINEFLQEIARMWLLITGFSWSVNPRRHFWLQGSTNFWPRYAKISQNMWYSGVGTFRIKSISVRAQMSQRENSKNHFGFESLWHLYRCPYMASFNDHS